jgi:predicted nucleic acid-binding protein
MALRISIDTCILLDLLLNQNSESIDKIRKHRNANDELVICGIVFGELCPIFEQNRLDVNVFLFDMDITVEVGSKAHYSYAGKRWNDYRRRRRLICPRCGRSVRLSCPNCHAVLHFRQHILSDFIIGAFSELDCDALLTRDYGYYKTYFPGLKLL